MFYITVSFPSYSSGVKLCLVLCVQLRQSSPLGNMGFMSCQSAHLIGSILIAAIILSSYQGRCVSHHGCSGCSVFSYKGSKYIAVFCVAPLDMAVIVYLFCLVQGNCYKQVWAWPLASAKMLLFPWAALYFRLKSSLGHLLQN